MGNVVLSISKIIFPSAKYLKTINMYLKALRYYLNNIEWAELGIFTQWNVLIPIFVV